MRVFVVGTGRCGTVTFSKAAGHATNYTVGHESNTGAWAKIGDWDYPDNHIEVSSHLIIAIPILRKRYPQAKWVHLIREREACVNSLARLRPAMRAFAYVFYQQASPNERDAAGAVYDTSNALCRALLPPYPTFTLQLEYSREHWLSCWHFMGCEGDFKASLAEWDVKYNAGRPHGKELQHH
uniref:Uncharacterized protein n=1 Tax=viral metagenome TaxID=1070528 RepID=A0A6M3XK25_9ZZZZ